MLFIVFAVRFVEKEPKSANSRQCRGSVAVAKKPLATAKVLVMPKDPHATARLRRKIFPSLGLLRRNHYSQHGNVVFLFRFVFQVVLKTCLLDY